MANRPDASLLRRGHIVTASPVDGRLTYAGEIKENTKACVRRGYFSALAAVQKQRVRDECESVRGVMQLRALETDEHAPTDVHMENHAFIVSTGFKKLLEFTGTIHDLGIVFTPVQEQVIWLFQVSMLPALFPEDEWRALHGIAMRVFRVDRIYSACLLIAMRQIGKSVVMQCILTGWAAVSAGKTLIIFSNNQQAGIGMLRGVAEFIKSHPALKARLLRHTATVVELLDAPPPPGVRINDTYRRRLHPSMYSKMSAVSGTMNSKSKAKQRHAGKEGPHKGQRGGIRMLYRAVAQSQPTQTDRGRLSRHGAR